jgi:hypothetical protein
MPRQNAEDNLKEFGKELGLQGLVFDENNTCILGIDDQFSMHLTYEPNSDRLYMYSPLLDGLPKDDKIKLKLYQRLLEGGLLGGQMAGGGVGIAVAEGLVLMHCYLEMGHAVPAALRAFAPLYVETVEKWRKICRDISEGREPSVTFDIPGRPAQAPAAVGASRGPSGGVRV